MSRLGLPPTIRACLFDLDRVPTRTATVHACLDGTRSILVSRGVTLPDGAPEDPSGALTLHGLSNQKNALVLRRLIGDGVEVFEGSVRYVRAVRAAGLTTAVASASANTVVGDLAELLEEP